tara:strand:- start:1665 stop:2126 length:462 start_codon:yes stop_codon:yes gene_type:complete
MINALLVVHIILAVCMIALVLFQKSEGGALGMGGSSGGGGMGGFMSARGTANLLTRTTGILATLFFMTTLGLAIAFKGGATQSSILEDVVPTQTESVKKEPVKADEGSIDPAVIGKTETSSSTVPAASKKKRSPKETSKNEAKSTSSQAKKKA